MIDVSPIVDWLVAGVPGARGAPAVVDKLCADLRAAGIPLDRAEAFVRTLHPYIVGRSFLWRDGGPVEVRENSYAYLNSPAFLASPAAKVFRTGQTERRRAGEPPEPDEAPFAEWFEQAGLTDFIAAPLSFLSGEFHAITFATRRPGGFGDEDIAAVERIIAPLSRVAEILALSRTAANLLDTYVGHNAGERILAGKIRRGDMEPIFAVIWLSDLRGFTEMASAVSPGDLIRALNELFECQVGAIVRHGGEVLKFMGDGLLAIFPIVEGGKSIGELCDTALDAAEASWRDLAELNQRRKEKQEPELRFGIGLHVGEVVYGNIGGAHRLDFTCIGNAVNLAARLEGVASKFSRPLVVSEAFAEATTRETELLAEVELKGVPGLQRAFALCTKEA
jgi:adenylate cyclase